MAEHDVAPLGEIHRIANWEYADATARLAATGFLASDVGKWAKQTDDGSYWELTDDSPIVWAQRTGGGGALADDSVTNAKLANMAQATIKGRASGAGTGDPTDLTGTQATAILDNVVGDSGSGGTKGLVPAPAAGDAAADKFLKATGAWDTPTGLGGSPGGVDGDVQYRVDASTFGGSPLKRVDANTVKQENGTNAQSFSITKTTTNGYKFTITNVSNRWQLKSESSSGTPDSVSIYAGSSSTFYGFDMSAFLPPQDITQNLGSLGNRWNQINGNEVILGASGTISWSTSSTKLKTAGDGVLDVQTQNTNVGGTLRFFPRTAAQITADQNNYNPGGLSFHQRWSSDASRNVTGMTHATQVDGQVHRITNVGSNDIVLIHQSGSSTAANRFLSNTGADITLGANEIAEVWYDGTTQRWRVCKL